MTSQSELQSNPEHIKKSTSRSETGHAKNIANFHELISFCKGYGVSYNPSKESLKIPALETLEQKANDDFNACKSAKAFYDITVNDRKNTFTPLRPLATRVMGAFTVSGAGNLALADARTINRKLQGSKSTKTTSDSPTVSTSQQSFDRQADHFANLIHLLSESNTYNPNETELQTPQLEATLATLLDSNRKVVSAYTDYSNALLNRNRTLYDPVTGLLQTAKEVKVYVKSLFGTSSPQYKQISSITFTKTK